MKLKFTRWIIWMLLAGAAPAWAAPDYSIVKHFGILGANPVGPLAQAPDGTLFGAAYSAFTNQSYKVNGLIFRVQPDGSGYTVIKPFTNSFGYDGEGPRGVALAGAVLYGVTEYGGLFGYGTVFSMATNGLGFTIVHNFGSTEGDGLYPVGSVLVSSGIIYGTTYEGGNDYGTIYALSVLGDTSGYGYLHQFTYDDGAYPSSGLTLSNNWLYGMADYGGGDGIGVEYKVTTGGAGYSSAFFTAGTNGGPGSFVMANNGTMFGVKNCGNVGTVFISNPYTNLHNFAFADGTLGSLALVGNTLYGTCSATGGSGLVYSMRTNGSLFKIVRSFSGPDGANPFFGVVAPNQIFGTTDNGGTAGSGTLFDMTTNGGNFVTVCGFNPNDGAEPNPVILAGGAFYGTTLYGGTYNYGTIYSVNADGSASATLHSFNGSDGNRVSAGLVLSGNILFGAAAGGDIGSGTIFSIQTNGGNFTVWHYFNGSTEGGLPYGTLTSANGRFYGTTYQSSIGQETGTIFALDQTGANFTILTNYGLNSFGGVAVAGDTLYGAGIGVNAGYGSVFSVKTNGTGLRFLYNFALGDGVYPAGAVALSGGVIYGTTVSGADLGYGAVFAVTTDGTGFTKLHSFAGGNELTPLGQLLVAGGAVYGTTSASLSAIGTLFSVGTDGAGFTLLAPFSANNGYAPIAGVISAGGSLYGTTRLGGHAGLGVLYQVSNVSLTAPPTISLAVSGLLVTATANDPNPGASISQVTFVNSNSTVLSTDSSSPFTFNWTSAPVGNNLISAIVTDSLGLSATSAPVVVSVNQKNTNAPVFTLGASAYTVAAGQGSVNVAILKSLNSSNGVVAYTTTDGTAVAVTGGVGNYQATSGTLTFSSSQASQTIAIPIVNNPVYEGNITFSFALSKMGTGLLGSPNSAVITITPSGSPPPPSTNSFLTHVFPPAPPAHADSLSVVTQPSSAQGQWRLVWETNWRNSGDIIAGLQDGNYQVEFSPVPNFITPLDTVYPVSSEISGGAAVVTNQYIATGLAQNGSLSITILPSGLAGQWQLQGETTWHNTGFVISNLVAGVHDVLFNPVANFITPPAMSVNVGASQQNSVTATYLVNVAPGGVAPTLLDFATQTSPANDQPYAYCGQLLTSVGYGTGCVVRERVVLTAGHLVFDDATLSYVSGANWFFQKDAGTYDPPAQIPAGSYLLDGYAAARTNEDTPGQSTPTSFNLDVTALFFTDKDAGGGGYSGYLVSDKSTNWLTENVNQTMAGYPVENLPGLVSGCIYAYPQQNYAFTGVFSNVFSTTGLTGYPGESGAPLFSLAPGAIYYPAGIYLGASANASIFRSIDSAAANLISDADISSFTGANHVGGGVVTISYNSSGSSGFGYYKIILGPPGAVTAGAGWKITQVSGGSFSSDSNLHAVAPGNYTLAFAPAAGYVAPANQPLTITANQTANINVTYATGSGPVAQFSNVAFNNGLLTLTLMTPDSQKFALERSTNLVNWTALVTNTASANGSLSFTNNTATNHSKAAFFRVRAVAP